MIECYYQPESADRIWVVDPASRALVRLRLSQQGNRYCGTSLVGPSQKDLRQAWTDFIAKHWSAQQSKIKTS